MTGKKNQSGGFGWRALIHSPLAFIALVRDKYTSAQAAREMADRVVDIIDPSIKSIRGYRKRIIPPLLRCLDHCAKIVAQIPGPIPLDAANYSSSPLIKAAFKDRKAVATILRLAEAQQISPNEKEQNRVALLTMTHSESEFFGTSREGQMIVGDARLKAVTFSDHKVVGIATTLEDSRQQLEKVIFDVIIESASHELSDRRADLGELREKREKLKAMLKLFGESASQTEELEQARGKKLDKVKSYLKESESNLSAAKADVETPADRLNFLVDFLARPENIMDIRLVSLRLDWSNVITSNPEVSANTITFAQCAIHETRRRDAVLITYVMDKENKE
ncbi:hypothetical protein [Desulfopila sp. IMCC35008]|uniref:hypothetical protein n=1 Tax=Desulfopila sp. IMCC35008 TaxID=2653858 RepID=UPI0013D5498E|nr:hypothetical protein [Desulfopila sp. IMCC35008]